MSADNDKDCVETREENARLKAELKRAELLARSATEELQGFVYAASHDVKEALRSVNSYSQLMVRQAQSDPELAEYGGFVTSGIRNAVAILDRMNSFARIDLSPRKSSMNLSLPLQMAVIKLDSVIRQSGASVLFNGLHDVNANDTQLQLLFENYIDNALKYASPSSGAPLKIEVSSEESDEGVDVSVADNGPGILPEYQSIVFQPFKRLHGKDIPGIGLGLAICSKIALAHGGRVWVESDGKLGSRFHTLLPY